MGWIEILIDWDRYFGEGFAGGNEGGEELVLGGTGLSSFARFGRDGF